MRQNISEANDNPHIAKIQWYEMDETIHGSVAIYHSKEAYKANLAFQEESRSKSIKERHIQSSTKRMARVMSISPAFDLRRISPSQGPQLQWPVVAQ